MAASATQYRRFRASRKRLLDAIDDAFGDIGIGGVRWVRGRDLARASTGFNFLSYGENLSVELFDDGEVEVHSECVWPLQFIDWGKNAANCRRLLDAIADRLED